MSRKRKEREKCVEQGKERERGRDCKTPKHERTKAFVLILLSLYEFLKNRSPEGMLCVFTRKKGAFFFSFNSRSLGGGCCAQAGKCVSVSVSLCVIDVCVSLCVIDVICL